MMKKRSPERGKTRELDYLEIFKEFNKKKIEYIVCGGVALNLFGVPRITYDIDLLLKMEDRNLNKFIKLIKKWGFKPKIPVDIMDFASRESREKWIKEKSMRAFNLYNPDWPISEIDILINVPVNYEAAIKGVIYKIIKDVKIPLVSVKHLIKMKQATGRKQDESDVRYLKKIL
ncbi:MAG: hypothetical protein ABIH40_01230 [Candidatus Omnitrophota bacterium]